MTEGWGTFFKQLVHTLKVEITDVTIYLPHQAVKRCFHRADRFRTLGVNREAEMFVLTFDT
jgi:hypothetical protein